jgi:uncharacterized protein YndB with AHSA1/START domain
MSPVVKKVALAAGAFAGLLLVVVAYASTKPDSFRVARTTTIKAAPEKIYPFVQDFHQWSVWSPYEKMDPAMQRTFSGTPAGQGAVYGWKGNGNAGSGRMEITEAAPPKKLAIKLDFTAPFEASNVAEFTFEPNGEETRVTWAMGGKNSLGAKVMQLFFDMDKLVGKDFEAGLQNLKVAAEK